MASFTGGSTMQRVPLNMAVLCDRGEATGSIFHRCYSPPPQALSPLPPQEHVPKTIYLYSKRQSVCAGSHSHLLWVSLTHRRVSATRREDHHDGRGRMCGPFCGSLFHLLPLPHVPPKRLLVSMIFTTAVARIGWYLATLPPLSLHRRRDCRP